MAKKKASQTSLKADILHEMGLLESKAVRRSMSSNWFHYRYIWMLISELEDFYERSKAFTTLDLLITHLNIRKP